MHLTIRRPLWVLLVCGSVATLSASPPVIGVARSRGAFLINNASVPGTATILNGASVRTLASSSEVSLKTGERLTLASSSAATFYQDRVVLQSGLAELDHMAQYSVDSGSLRIGASGTGAHIRVAVDASRQVKVAALGGTAEVRDPKGVLIARVFPGTALQLHTAAQESDQFTGIVEKQGNNFLLNDETTHVTTELRGENLSRLVGKRVRVTGKTIPGGTPAAGASQIVTVTAVTTIGPAAAASAGGAAAGAAVSSGVSAGTIAVIGGVAAGAGTVGGLAVAGTFSDAEPVSR